MSYLIPFYDLPLLDIIYVYLIITPWMYNSQHNHVVPLCFLVSGTKYSHTLFLNLTFFDFLNILFDWYDSRDQVSKLFKGTSLRRLGNLSIMKYPITSFVRHQSTFNSLLLIQCVMKNKQMSMCLVSLIIDDLPLFSRRMELLLSC